MKLGKQIMAGRLLWWSLGALLVEGCLIPQDDNVFPDLPAQKNRPLRILASAVRPKTPYPLDVGPDCVPEQAFLVPVDDPDLDDRIRNKWLIDDEEPGNTWVSGVTIPPSDGGTGRLVKAPAIFSVASVFYTDPSHPHKLTVTVADGEFGSGIDVVEHPAGVGAGGKPITNESYTDGFTWVINATRNDLPKCPPH